MSEGTIHTARLDLILPPEAKKKLQIAADSAGRSVNDFVLESALARADETLADRNRFGLNAARWQEFLDSLDTPPRLIPRLRKLLLEPGVFEKPQ